MSGENAYRTMLLALVLVFLPIGVSHRIRSFTGE
jgi:hypothetical protein